MGAGEQGGFVKLFDGCARFWAGASKDSVLLVQEKDELRFAVRGAIDVILQASD